MTRRTMSVAPRARQPVQPSIGAQRAPSEGRLGTLRRQQVEALLARDALRRKLVVGREAGCAGAARRRGTAREVRKRGGAREEEASRAHTGAFARAPSRASGYAPTRRRAGRTALNAGAAEPRTHPDARRRWAGRLGPPSAHAHTSARACADGDERSASAGGRELEAAAPRRARGVSGTPRAPLACTPASRRRRGSTSGASRPVKGYAAAPPVDTPFLLVTRRGAAMAATFLPLVDETNNDADLTVIVTSHRPPGHHAVQRLR